MDLERLEILREAFATRQRKEEIERAIGRTVRRNNLDFKVYIEIVSELREQALSSGETLDSVAKRLLGEHNQKS